MISNKHFRKKEVNESKGNWENCGTVERRLDGSDNYVDTQGEKFSKRRKKLYTDPE
jgi:hypothetical protein